MYILSRSPANNAASCPPVPARISKNTARSANSSAGTSGQETYDPTRDIKLQYQRALAVNIALDIRADDGIIIKKVINGLNRDPRFGNLIGERTTGYAL